MIYTVTLNPALDRTITLPSMSVGRVNRVPTARLDAGGKGINVSKTLSAAGIENIATGILGGHNGKIVESLLTNRGVRCDFLKTESETRMNIVLVETDMVRTTDLNEPGAQCDDRLLDDFLSHLEKHIQPGDLTVLAGSLPPGAEISTYRRFTEKLHSLGSQVFLDADGDVFREGVSGKSGISGMPDLVKPNLHEMEQFEKQTLATDHDRINACQRLLRNGIRTVVLSLGSEGALFISKENCLRADSLKVSVQSTVGAGDAMLAAWIMGEVKGMSFKERAKLSIAMSAAKVMLNGTQPPEWKTVEQLLPSVQVYEPKV